MIRGERTFMILAMMVLGLTGDLIAYCAWPDWSIFSPTPDHSILITIPYLNHPIYYGLWFDMVSIFLLIQFLGLASKIYFSKIIQAAGEIGGTIRIDGAIQVSTMASILGFLMWVCSIALLGPIIGMFVGVLMGVGFTVIAGLMPIIAES